MSSKSLDLQRLWSSLARKKWPALALLPVEANTRASALVAPASELLGALGPPGGFRLVTAERVPWEQAGGLAVEIQDEIDRGVRVVLVADSPAHNPAILPLLRVCSSAVLVVELGTTRTEAVEELLELVGRERVLGCVAVPPGALPTDGP